MFRPLIFQPIEGEPEAFEDEDGTLTVSVVVAESQDGQRVVTADCSLAPIRTTEDIWEFSFAITCTSLDGSELPFSTQDRVIAAGYVPSVCREPVVQSVCRVAARLATYRQPTWIYRVQKAAHLPPKGQRKHDLITSELQSIGYGVTRSGTDRFGRAYVIMRQVR